MAETLLNKLFSLVQLSDEQAMLRVRATGDPEAFARLVKRWEGPLQRLCVRMLADEHRAQDLTQEAFSRLFTRRENYEPSAKFSTYLWRITLNLCRDELRRRQRWQEDRRWDTEEGFEDAVSDEVLSADIAPDVQLVQNEEQAGVRRALERLAPLYREVLILRHYEGLKFREISDVLSIPEGTVKSRMSEGLSQLGKILTKSPDVVWGLPPETDHYLS